MSKKLVSVIIPTYNYANYISEAIGSVLNQNFPQNEIEIIVVDDGSTDDTSNKIQNYKDKVYYIFQKNSGKAWATKTAIDAASGKYIFNLDADDLFLPEKLSKTVGIFEKDGDIIHVAHPAIYWYTDNNTRRVEPVPDEIKGQKIFGKKLLSYFYRRKILFGGGSTFTGRAEVLKGVPIKKDVDMYIDEYLVLFTLNNGYSFFIKEPLSMWRIHDRNFSDSNYNLESMIRNRKSMEAVLSEVLKNDFEEEVKKLYLLKTKISDLAIKEVFGKKSFSDIFSLWLYIFKNLIIFNKDIFKITKSYTVLNRSLPTFMLRLLKKLIRG